MANHEGQRPRERLVAAMRAAAVAVRLSDLGDQALESLRTAVDACGVLLYRYGERGELECLGGNLVDLMPAYRPELASTDPLQQPPQSHAARGEGRPGDEPRGARRAPAERGL